MKGVKTSVSGQVGKAEKIVDILKKYQVKSIR